MLFWLKPLAAIALKGEKKAIRLLEVASGNEREGFEILGADVSRLAWSPDGRYLAGGNDDGTVWLWDVIAKREVHRFPEGHFGKITALVFSSDGSRLASGSSDTTAIVWDLRNLLCSEALGKNQTTVESLWSALGEEDPLVAYRSIHQLTRMPDKALTLLHKQLLPETVANPEQIISLLTKLDDNNFDVRMQAMKQLKNMGARIEPVLRKALSQKPSLEAAQNIHHTLDKLLGPSIVPSGLNLSQLRACRGVEALERIGTPAARQVLDELSQLPESYIQSEEAKAALYRLSKSVLVQRDLEESPRCVSE